MKLSHTDAFGQTYSCEVDFKETAAAVLDRCKAFFNKDTESVALFDWLKGRTERGAHAASFVWVVGMRQPLPLGVIYQPTRLAIALADTVQDQNGRTWGTLEPQEISVSELLQDRVNSIVTAGAGFGKTTFMHSVFQRLASSDTVTPLLFTLRESDDIEALREFTAKAISLAQKFKGKRRLLVLADGYDEISTDSRRQVSSLLNKLAIDRSANYVLTCRDHYDIYALTDAQRVQVADFTHDDQITFMHQYFQICERSDLDKAAAVTIHGDLTHRGLGDLLKHPLLLTLACISKADTPGAELRGSADLIENAFNALALRWDQQKGASRERTTPLSGPQRQTILRKLAYSLEIESVPERRAVGVTRAELERFGFSDVEPLDVLREMAQFYGMFVQIKDKWGFVHRPIHDYLAAQHAVRNGIFAEQLAQNTYELNSRTAFATVLFDHATEALVKILSRPDDQAVARTVEEVLLNEPSFHVPTVWKAMLTFTGRQRFEYEYDGWRLKCKLSDEFITKAGSRFLEDVIRLGCKERTKSADILLAYAVAELKRRHVILQAETYAALLDRFQNERMTFQVMGYHQLGELLHQALPDEQPRSRAGRKGSAESGC